jgi:type II secretory pathway component PulF
LAIWVAETNLRFEHLLQIYYAMLKKHFQHSFNRIFLKKEFPLKLIFHFILRTSFFTTSLHRENLSRKFHKLLFRYPMFQELIFEQNKKKTTAKEMEKVKIEKKLFCFSWIV